MRGILTRREGWEEMEDRTLEWLLYAAYLDEQERTVPELDPERSVLLFSIPRYDTFSRPIRLLEDRLQA
jgi:hypothetical protein